MSAKSIYNLIRALSYPYVGAHFNNNGEIIRVWRSSISKKRYINLEPGKVLSCDNNGLLVQTGDGVIRLLDFEPKRTFMKGSYL